MNVASLELCKELYELSGWSSQITHNEPTPSSSLVDQVPICPAYDLGYLLRELPHRARVIRHNPPYTDVDCYLVTWNTSSHNYQFSEDTPEDAACKLAIELWKQGVLK